MVYEEEVAAAFSVGLVLVIIAKTIRRVNYRLESAWTNSWATLKRKLRKLTCVWLWNRPKCLLILLPPSAAAVAVNSPTIKGLTLYKGIRVSAVMRYMKMDLMLKLFMIALAGAVVGDLILSGVLKQLAIIVGLSPYILLKRILV